MKRSLPTDKFITSTICYFSVCSFFWFWFFFTLSLTFPPLWRMLFACPRNYNFYCIFSVAGRKLAEKKCADLSTRLLFWKAWRGPGGTMYHAQPIESPLFHLGLPGISDNGNLHATVEGNEKWANFRGGAGLRFFFWGGGGGCWDQRESIAPAAVWGQLMWNACNAAVLWKWSTSYENDKQSNCFVMLRRYQDDNRKCGVGKLELLDKL